MILGMVGGCGGMGWGMSPTSSFMVYASIKVYFTPTGKVLSLRMYAAFKKDSMDSSTSMPSAIVDFNPSKSELMSIRRST